MPFLPREHAEKYALERDEHLRVERFRNAFALIRQLNPSMSGNLVECLLLVTLKPGGGPTDYAKDLEVTSGQVSRWMLELGERARDGGDGHGLIQRLGGSTDLREVHYTLTPKGKAMMKKFSEKLGVGIHG